MKLAECCVIEQHIDRLHKGVEPTNLGLGTLDATALIVRIARGWANDMAATPKVGQDADVVLPLDLENAFGRAFRSRRGVPAGSLLRFVRHNGKHAARGSGSDATMAGQFTARREEAGRAPELCK